MRLVLLSLVALLLAPAALPVEAHGTFPGLLVHRYSEAPGWIAESFTTDGHHIRVTIGAGGDGERMGHVVNLYKGSGELVGGGVVVFIGGNQADVVLRSGDVAVTTDDLTNGRHRTPQVTFGFACDDACNPSHDYTLVASGAGDRLHSWGYGLFAENGTLVANRTGSAAGVESTRDFEGTTLHATYVSSLGVSVADDVSRTLHVQGELVGAFAKWGGATPRHASAQTPSGEMACTCAFERWGAGEYAFRYSATDLAGQEGHLVWADVSMP